MDTQKKQLITWDGVNVCVRLKLAALWTSLMFLIIYLDYFHLYMPGKIEDISQGKVYIFEITQEFLFGALSSVAIPTLMIFFSVAFSVSVNRWTNITVASVYIPFMLFNLAGEAWPHMVFGAFLEVVLLSLIIIYAWKWPRIEI